MQEQLHRVWELHKKKLWLAAGMLISLLGLVWVFSGDLEQEIGRLNRPSLREGESLSELIVMREDGSRSEISVQVKPRSCSAEEAEEIFEAVLALLPDEMKGSNSSLEQVESDIYLPESWDEFGVDLIWSSSSPEIIRSSGTLAEDRSQSEAVQVSLQVLMKLQEYSRTEIFTVTVLPPEGLSWEERLRLELLRQEELAGAEEELKLPTEFEGEQISFAQREDKSQLVGVSMLPLVLSLFIYLKDNRKNEKEQKQRQEEIMADYPEVIVKMTVLYQAGMSMRNVWERIAVDERKKGGRLRPIYEEIAFACNSMADGVPETEAYRQFGRRCCTAGCLKLGNMLAGNVRRGTRHLTAMMAEESSRAWEQRKHMARRSGEKAGTKMLLPMFMMFGVVLAMIVVPAFNGFM